MFSSAAESIYCVEAAKNLFKLSKLGTPGWWIIITSRVCRVTFFIKRGILLFLPLKWCHGRVSTFFFSTIPPLKRWSWILWHYILVIRQRLVYSFGFCGEALIIRVVARVRVHWVEREFEFGHFSSNYGAKVLYQFARIICTNSMPVSCNCRGKLPV